VLEILDPPGDEVQRAELLARVAADLVRELEDLLDLFPAGHDRRRRPWLGP